MYSNAEVTKVVGIVFLILTFLSSLTGCYSYRVMHSKKFRTKLSTELIFEIRDWDIVRKNNQLIHVDSNLTFRSSFFPNRYYGLKEGGKHTKLLPKYAPDTSYLEIPEHYKDICVFYPDSLDLINTRKGWAYYSPLLPTKKKNLFVIQAFNGITLVDNGKRFAKMFTESFFFYEIRGTKIKKLELEQNYFYDHLFFE